MNKENSKYSVGPTPSWVKEYDVPIEPIALKSTHVNLQQLLIDHQKNLEEKTLYIHFAAKPLTQQGIDKIAQLNMSYKSHQKFIIHKINVYRNGICQDRLNSTRIELLKREQGLESNFYRGDLTLAHFLTDIRVGDIVEYACSIEGSALVFHFADWISMADHIASERNHQRILSHPSRFLAFKSDIEQFQNSLFGFISQPHLELKSMHEKIAKAHGPLGSRFLERLRNPILSL